MITNRRQKQFLIFLVDFLILSLCVYLALALRSLYLPSFKSFFSHLVEFLPLIFFWVILQYIAGLYVLEGNFYSSRYGVRIFFVGLCTLFVGFAWFYLATFTSIGPRTILILYCSISFIAVCLWRYILTVTYVHFSQIPSIGIIGNSEAIDELIEYSHKFSYMSYNIAGILEEGTTKKKYRDIPIYHSLESFLKLIEEKDISQIIVIDKKGLSAKIHKSLFTLLKNRVSFVSVASFYESYIRKIPITEVNEVWFLENIDLSNKKMYSHIKRFLDIIASLILLLLSLPFYPIISFIIKIESKGPIFFTQTRAGYLGTDFTVLKFRSMSISNNNFAPTGQNDARITKFGNIMRKTRIDELPQLINVLKGEMSLIGPRPERPELIEELEKVVPYYKQRLLIRPGISGWDQVSGEYHSPSVEDTKKKLQYDLYYVKNMSLALDVSILAKTLKTVVSRGGL